jgi:hypothetical protein
MSWITAITLAASVVGAAAWTPWLYEWLAKPILKARMISQVDNQGTFQSGPPCLLHFRAFSIVSLRKAFNIADVEIKVTYRGPADSYSGTWFWARTDLSRWTHGGRQYKCIISPEDALPYIGSLPKNQTKTVYLLFKVDKAELQEIDELALRFVEQSGHLQDIIVKSEDVHDEQMVWDPRIWEEV